MYLSKLDVINRLAKKNYSGIDAKIIYDDFISTIRDMLLEGKSVKLGDVCYISPYFHEGRLLHGGFGDHMIKPYATLRVHVYKTFKRDLNRYNPVAENGGSETEHD